MLINLDTIVSKYGTPKGVIHMGAHLAEELEDYKRHNIKDVIWIEANPYLYKELKDKLKGTNHHAICELLSDVDDKLLNFNITFNEWNGNAQSSSVLELGLHEHYHPHIKKEKSILLKTKTVSKIFLENSFNTEDYDFINMDLQGYELPALKGYGDNLNHVKYVYTEVNTDEVYKNCTKLEELDEYLSSYGFDRVEIEMTDAQWGDALYIKR